MERINIDNNIKELYARLLWEFDNAFYKVDLDKNDIIHLYDKKNNNLLLSIFVNTNGAYNIIRRDGNTFKYGFGSENAPLKTLSIKRIVNLIDRLLNEYTYHNNYYNLSAADFEKMSDSELNYVVDKYIELFSEYKEDRQEYYDNVERSYDDYSETAAEEDAENKYPAPAYMFEEYYKRNGENHEKYVS